MLGATQQDLYLIAAILPYVAFRGAATGPLFQLASGAFLTCERFVTEVRRLLQMAGLDLEQHSGHSFRIEAATAAAQAGLEGHTIHTQGRWQSSDFCRIVWFTNWPMDSE